MDILLIGQSVVDHIYEEGRVTTQPGGVFYSAQALRYIISPDDKISLSTSVTKNSYPLFKNIYEQLDPLFLEMKEEIPTVHLTIHPDKERDERYENIEGKLTPPAENLNHFSGILLNMVTGHDITIDQLELIRARYTGPIYLDFHSLTRGADKELNRIFRPVPDVERWLQAVDIVQVNRSELLTLSDKKEETEIAAGILSNGVKYLLITQEDKGAKAYFLNSGILTSLFIPAIKIGTVNKVGCGDTFGGVFFYNYLRSNDFVEALTLANIAGGITASYNNLDRFVNLKNDILSRYT